MVDRANEVAVSILTRVIRENAYLDLLLRSTRRRHPNAAWLPKTEATVRGVLEHHILLKKVLDDLLRKGYTSLHPDVAMVLLVAAYRLIYSQDSGPGVTNAAIDLLKLNKKVWAVGIANAVLRRLAQDPERFATVADARLSVAERASAPSFWLQYLKKAPQIDPEAAIVGLRRNPGLHIVVDDPVVVERLCSHGCVLESHLSLPTYRLVSGHTEFWRLFNRAELAGVRIQDAGIAVWLAMVEAALSPSDRVWDAFCAPGGKLLPLAAAGFDVIGTDVHPGRLQLVQDEAARRGINVQFQAMDAGSPTWAAGTTFSTIIADMPCSGSGTVGRHPEIPLHIDEKAVARHAEQQLSWLHALVPYCEPGGSIWYSTCSVFVEENEAVVDRFLREQPNWRRATHTHPVDQCAVDVIRFWPHLHQTAGFCAQQLVYDPGDT